MQLQWASFNTIIACISDVKHNLSEVNLMVIRMRCSAQTVVSCIVRLLGARYLVGRASVWYRIRSQPSRMKAAASIDTHEVHTHTWRVACRRKNDLYQIVRLSTFTRSYWSAQHAIRFWVDTVSTMFPQFRTLPAAQGWRRTNGGKRAAAMLSANRLYRISWIRSESHSRLRFLPRVWLDVQSVEFIDKRAILFGLFTLL